MFLKYLMRCVSGTYNDGEEEDECCDGEVGPLDVGLLHRRVNQAVFAVEMTRKVKTYQIIGADVEESLGGNQRSND